MSRSPQPGDPGASPSPASGVLALAVAVLFGGSLILLMTSVVGQDEDSRERAGIALLVASIAIAGELLFGKRKFPIGVRSPGPVRRRRAEDSAEQIPPPEVLLERQVCQEKVTEALMRSESLEEATQAVLGPCCRVTSAVAGAVWLVDPDANLLRCARFFVRDEEAPLSEFLPDAATLARGRGTAGRVWVERRAAWVGDRNHSADSTICKQALARGWSGGCAFPIRVGDRVDGVIELFTEDPVDPDEHLRRMMESIGGQIGLFLQRSRIEERLRRDEQMHHAVSETAPDAILTIDATGTILSVNPAAVRLFGYEAGELVGSPVAKLVPEDLRAKHVAGLTRFLETREPRLIGRRVEMPALRKDGSTLLVEIALAHWRTKDGDCFTGILRDVTELRRAQEALTKKTAALERSNSELDDFAYVASHDLKEPLRGIHNYSKFLLEDYGSAFQGEAQEMLETLPRLAQRMDALLDVLLQFSRVGRQELTKEPTDLNEVLRTVLEDCRATIEEHELEVRIPMPLPTVVCDAVGAAQVFRNLITNAAKYNDKPGKWVEIGFDAPPGTATARPRGSSRADAIVFRVRDNGIGIPQKHASSVFRIFKRLHGRDEYGGGHGAGLTIVKKIVERHGGRIWLESEVGVGSTFFFTLADARAQAAILPEPIRLEEQGSARGRSG